MEELFNPQLPDGQRPDLQLCIFPHLKEFLAIDLREEQPRVLLLNTDDVFVEEFFRSVEAEFSELVRERSDSPFAHMITLPGRLEEIIRELAMTAILDRLGIYPDNEEKLPTVVVFVISGGALAMPSERVVEGLKRFLQVHSKEPAVAEWESMLSRLVAEENAILQQLNQQELTEVLRSDSPDYFTLWENRN